MSGFNRLLIGFVVLTSNAVIAQDQSPVETVDLLIVAGQSNAVGFDASPKDLPKSDADKDILFWWKCGDPPPDKHDSTSQQEWVSLQPQPLGNPIKPRNGRQYGNYAQPEGGFGPEISLARLLKAKQTRSLAVLKVAFSGTDVRNDWDPGENGTPGPCYKAFVTEFKTATKAAKANGVKLKPRALIWIQGESDANKTNAPKYADSLEKLIQKLRNEMASPKLPALIALNTRFSNGTNKFVPVIVEQQKLLVSRSPNIHYVDTSTATIANSAHYDAAGTLLVGRLFAEQLLKVESKTSAVDREQ